MNVLLLGGSGMVGRNIRDHPKYNNYHFFCPSRRTLNIFEKNDLKAYVRTNSIDTIINAAGKVGGIQDNISHPFDFLHGNLIIGVNLANVVKELNIPRVINLGSSCMYPKSIEGMINENDLLTGRLEKTNEGYALSKIVTLKYFEYLSRESCHSYKTLMPCNLYGRYDHFNLDKSHLIASIIMKISSVKDGETVEVWGDGTARREFMDAFDLADAIFFSLENYESIPSILNVGTGFDYTIYEYYEKAAYVLKKKCRFVFNTKRPVGMKRKLLDVKRIQNLGWRSTTSLEEGIKKAHSYYKETSL